MSARQRYIQTILYGNPDKVPLGPGRPRESTRAAWRVQGMPEGVDHMDAVLDIIGVDRSAALKMEGMNVTFRMIPEFEVKILDHKDGHYIISDWMGAVTEISDKFDESYLRMAKDFVTRKWHKFPVENRKDWEEMKTRFDTETKDRIGPDITKDLEITIKKDIISTIAFNGVFWQLREWCGFENLCMLMIEEPDFVMEMADFWGDFVLTILKKTIEKGVPDRALISEDMAYKAHSMISPAMTRQFILPQYEKWIPFLKAAGCSVIEVDSDGFIEELIPLWIETGVNACSPIEVAAYNDILKYRKMFGKSMAFVQGIDKRLMARGGRDLEDHVMKIVPELFKEGGFIPGCDHGVPPDISWNNYVEFTRMIAKLSGWL